MRGPCMGQTRKEKENAMAVLASRKQMEHAEHDVLVFLHAASSRCDAAFDLPKAVVVRQAREKWQG